MELAADACSSMRGEARRAVWIAGFEGVDFCWLVGPMGLVGVTDIPDLNAKVVPNWLPSNTAVSRQDLAIVKKID